MAGQFFKDLDISSPDVSLDVGPGPHEFQTTEVMKLIEAVFERERPDVVIVVGDVNSTLACALVAAKKGVSIIHVEAGLRSNDRNMPEEINRVLTDQLSELLYTTERSAQANLLREGIAPERIHFVGNVMIDTLLTHRRRAVPAEQTLGAAPSRRYAVVTLHRPSNVDNAQVLRGLLETLATIARDMDVIFPIHPRTQSTAAQHQLTPLLETPGIRLLPPQGYLEMVGLMREARVTLTDSGGVQEETTALGIPCLTLRENTERPITIEEGTNRLVGCSRPRIVAAAAEALRDAGATRRRIPELWDGHAAKRIVTALLAFGSRPASSPIQGD